VSTTDPIVIHLQAKDDGVNELFDSTERLIKKQKKAVEDTMRRMKDYHRTLGMTKQELEVYRLKQNGATDAQIRSATRIARLTALKEKDIQTNKRLNGSLRMIRGGFGQVGHQLQDITIQAQMGTDAFIILGQQGSQIASLFGPGGAMMGALLAVGAAGVTYFKSTLEGVDSLKALEESAQSIASLFNGPLLTGLQGVNDEIKELAEASESMARLRIALEMAKATQNLADAQKMLNEQLQINESVIISTAAGTEVLINDMNQLGKVFGISALNATKFSMSVEDLANQTDGSRDNFAELASEIIRSGEGNKKFRELAQNVLNLTTTIMTSESALKSFARAQEQLDAGTLGDDPEKDKRSRQQLQAVIDRNAIKTLQGEEQIRAVMTKRIDETLDAMQKLGKSEEEQQQMRLALEGELSRQIADMQNKRLAEFNKLDDARQKEIEATEKRRTQIAAVHQEELTGIDAINQKYDLKLQKVQNLANAEPALMAAASAEIIQINADRAAALIQFREDEYMAGVKELEKERQAHQDHRDSIQKMMDDGKDAFVRDLQARAYALEVALAERAINEKEHTEYRKQLQTEYANHLLDENLKIVGGLKNVEDSFVNASHAFITGAQNGTEAIQQFGRAIVDELIKSLVQMGVEHVKQMVIKKQIEAKGLAASVTANAGAMSMIATQAAPAATLVSLATAGGNSVPAVAGMGTAFSAARAMSLASFDGGGFTGMGSRSGGIDGRGGFPAILHPNETVIDHTRGQGQGITIINNIDASGNQDVDEKIAIAVTQSSRQTVEQVHNMMRRGRM
jgi:hypothetical protein